MTAGTEPLTELPAWKALKAHYGNIRNLHLRKLFAEDPKRGEQMSKEAAGIYLDYSKNRITAETLRLLLDLAEVVGLRARIDAMFRGEKINVSEQRAVLHVALRAPRAHRYWLMARMSCPRSTPCSTGWPVLPIRFAEGSGRVTPASAYATSSTSASVAPTSVL